MKRETKEWLILSVLVTLFLLAGVIAFAQDSLKVKIIKIKGEKIVMKTLERPRVKFITKCECPYRRKEIFWIKRQQVY